MKRSTPNPARRKPRGVLVLLPPRPLRTTLAGAAAALPALLLPAGCQTTRPQPVSLLSTTRPASAGLTAPTPWPPVLATVTPPAGWTPDPLKSNDKHTHQVWISPTGHTAFGVIHFTLPLPLSANFVLPFYLNAWRKDQGSATLLSKSEDPSLPGVHFVAEGGLYKTWSNLIVSGTDGWSIYAGVLRDQPVSQPELDLAKSARDHTHVGLPQPQG